MTLKEIKKVGYKRIIKQGETHQEVYEDLKTNKPTLNIKIADTLKAIPSKSVIEKYKGLRITYIILLLIIILLRILLIYGFYISNVKMGILLVATFFGIFLPVVAIYMTIIHKYNELRSFSFLFIVSLLRSIGSFESNIETIVVFFIFIAVILIGFLLPKYMQTNYKKTTIYNKETNKLSDINIQFEDVNFIKNDDILDDL
jgi:hypothetical protein